MSSFCKITIGKTPGATRANAMYITRHGACAVWETRNVPDEEHLGITRDDQRRSIADYLCEHAEQGRGERRDYRAVLSFDREVDSGKAMDMAKEWLEETKFRGNPTLVAFHSNTDNPHVHVLVTARDGSGKKLDLSDRQYKSFDKAWAKIYEREIERGVEKDHSEKSGEKTRWKQQYGTERRQGKERAAIVAELGPVPRDTPTIGQFYREQRSHDESRLADSLGRESQLLRRIQEDHRETGLTDSGTGDRTAGTNEPAREVLGSLQEAEGRAGVLRPADRGDEAAEVQPAEAIRDGARRGETEAREGVRAAQLELQGVCAGGDRQSGRESQGGTGKRRGDLRELRARVTERFREGVAGRGVEALGRAVRAIEERLKRIPDQLGIVKQQLRAWKADVWQRVTGQPYGSRI